MEKRSDTELLRACRKGQETAWEALVKRYQRLIYAIPRRAGLDEEEAAEIFQEVFTTLLEKLDGIEQPERLHAWLVTTAKRKTWRFISRRRASSVALRDDEEDTENALLQLPDNAPLPDATLQKLEEQHRVRAALMQIDERCRQLLTMLFYASVPPSYAEVAIALGTTEGSIGPTRARCLQKMMKLLS
jgi:RNA polymerase sigma factor (sigma-70 family)